MSRLVLALISGSLSIQACFLALALLRPEEFDIVRTSKEALFSAGATIQVFNTIAYLVADFLIISKPLPYQRYTARTSIAGVFTGFLTALGSSCLLAAVVGRWPTGGYLLYTGFPIFLGAWVSSSAVRAIAYWLAKKDRH
jgi:hypothetical protein